MFKKRSTWSRVMAIAFNHDIPVRGYHPAEIIAMLKANRNPLTEAEVAELRAMCAEIGFDYDKIRPRPFISRGSYLHETYR